MASTTERLSYPSWRRPPSCDACRLRKLRCVKQLEGMACARCLQTGVRCTTGANTRTGRQRTSNTSQQETTRAVGNGLADPGSQGRTSNANAPARGTSAPAGGSQNQDPYLSDYCAESVISLAEIVGQLSSHLIEAYFRFNSYPLPLTRWREFHTQFQDAGRRPEQMPSAMSEVLAVTLIAYGAHVTNAPAVLGPDAPSLPEADALDGRLISWGRRRSAACRIVTERAVRLADSKGVFRVESAESIAVLLLLRVLLDHGDPARGKSRAYRAAAIRHARSLAEDRTSRQDKKELFGCGLGWMLYLADTWQAASSETVPGLEDRDVKTLLDRENTLPLPTLAEFSLALNGQTLIWTPIMQVWDHIATLMRRVLFGSLNSSEDEGLDFLWDVYECVDETKRSIALLQSVLSQSFLTKRPGYNFLTAYCGGMPIGPLQITYVAHRAIHRKVAAWSKPRSRVTEQRVLDLHALKLESDRRMADGARELATILYSLLGSSKTGIGISATVQPVYKALPIWAEILCNLPTKEEDASVTYMLDEKIKEVGWLLRIFRSLGWAWADMAGPIAYVEAQYEALQRSSSALSL